MIADDHGVESIGGVMGGEASGCSEATTDVLVESALWDPLNIARTGRALGVNSDARYRFERGVDPAFTLAGLDLATRMIMELCGGSLRTCCWPARSPDTSRFIDFPWTEVKRLTGLSLPVPEMKLALTELGFHVSGGQDRVRVAPPSWRGDIEGKADLVEEIVRIAGLDRVDAVPFPRLHDEVPKPVLTVPPEAHPAGQARAGVARPGRGRHMVLHPERRGAALRRRPAGAGARQPHRRRPVDMRPSLLPGLLRAAQRNADRGFGDVALFEVGQVFLGDGETDQRMAAAAVRRGLARAEGVGRHWDGAARPADLFDAKADALALLSASGSGSRQAASRLRRAARPGPTRAFRHPPVWAQDHRRAFGEVHPKTCACST